MKKKILSLLMAVAIVACCIPISSLTALAVVKDKVWYYTSSSTKTAVVNKYTGYATNLVLPDAVDGYPVVLIDTEAFKDATTLVTVEIPASVTQINDSAFIRCTSLQSVNIKGDITSLGARVFEDCSMLKTVNLPDSLTSIGDYAFNGCSSLEEIHIGPNLQTIPAHLFSNCTNLKNIDIDADNQYVKIVDGILFNSDMTTLIKCLASKSGETYTVPETVTSICEGAFDSCIYLKEITIPENVSIGADAFKNCTSLTRIKLPDSLTSIPAGLFSGCTALESVEFSPNLTEIGEGAFKNCAALEGVNLPDSLTSIPANLFSGCAELKNVTLPSNLTTIGANAFENCTALESIILPDSLTSIPENLFSGCAKLKNLEFSPNLTDVGTSAFSGCSSLESITFPDSVTSISSNVFSGCSQLRTIIIPENITLSEAAFKDCTGLKSIILPNSLTVIPKSLFSGCTSLESVEFSPNLTEINMQSFYNCTSLKSITLPSTVTEITEAFTKCTSLKSVYISDLSAYLNIAFTYGAAPLSNGAVLYVNNEPVVDLVIPDGFSSVPKYAFNGCTSIETVTFPESVTSIDTAAFSGCTSLKAVAIPDAVTSVGISAFSNCTSLEDISIGSGVTAIERYTFSGCSSLTHVIIPNTVTSLDEHTFGECKNLVSVEMSTAATLRINTFVNNEKFTTVYLNADSDANRIADSVCGAKVYLNKLSDTAYWKVLGSTLYICGNGDIPTYTEASQLPWNDFLYQIKDVKIDDGITNVSEIISTANKGGDYSDSSDFSISLNGNNATILKYLGNDENVIIPPVLKGFTVTEIASAAFENQLGIKSVDIPSTVKKIHSNSFTGCENLNKVNVSDISAWINIAFDDAYSNPLSIAHNLYLNGELAENLVVPSGTTTIKAYTFAGCTSIKSIDMPSSITLCGTDAFAGCTSLEKVNISNLSKWCAVTFRNPAANPLYFAHNLYLNNELVANLVIPSSVTEILSYTFAGCTSITGVEIPSGLTYMNNDGFMDCNNLAGVYITDIASWFNVDFYSEKANPLSIAHNLYVNGELVDTLVIPSTVKKLKNLTLYGCTNVKNLVFMGSLTLSKPTETALENVYLMEYENSSLAAWFDSDVNVYFSKLGDKGAYWELDGDVLRICGSGALKSFDDDAVLPWAKLSENIKEIKSSDGVTNLSSVFYTSVYKDLIANATETLVLDGKVLAKHIGNTEKAVVNSDIEMICNGAFDSSVKDVSISKSVNTVSANAFDSTDGLTIRGYKGSAAYDFATSNGINFVELTSVKGCVTGNTADGPTMADAMALFNCIANNDKSFIFDYSAADYNNDGKVSLIDTLALLLDLAKQSV